MNRYLPTALTATLSASVAGHAATVTLTYEPGDEGRCWGNPETAYQGWAAEVTDLSAVFADGTELDFDAVAVFVGSDEAMEALCDALLAQAEEAERAATAARWAARNTRSALR